jgi:two-component system, OmpR family, sensor kinase
MKNQNDLIISIVAAVLGIGVSVACFFMKREPVAPAAPSAVVTTALALPAADPVMGNSLPSGGSAGGTGGGGFPGGGFPGGGFPGGGFPGGGRGAGGGSGPQIFGAKGGG